MARTLVGASLGGVTFAVHPVAPFLLAGALLAASALLLTQLPASPAHGTSLGKLRFTIAQGPVSYTHLDVYKRQRFLLPEPLPDSPSGKQSVAGQASKNQATVRKA